jgi:hypothetical protein
MKKLTALVLALALALSVSLAFAEKAIPDIEHIDLKAGETFHAAIGDYNPEDGTFVVRVYAWDTYDEDDVAKLTAGDIILAGGDIYVIKDEREESGDRVFIVNDDEEIYFEKFDGELICRNLLNGRIFMNVVSVLRLPVADDVVYEDASNPDLEVPAKIFSGLQDVQDAIKRAAEDHTYGLIASFTTVTINERLEIVKIHQAYDVAQ